MHKPGPPTYHKLSKLRFLYCCFAWSLLIVMVQFFFLDINSGSRVMSSWKYNYYSTREVEKTIFTSFQYTNLPGFSERGTCPNLCQMLKEAMMLLLVTPCHVVKARLLQWSPPWLYSISFLVNCQCHYSYGNGSCPMHDKKAVSFPQNVWGHELEIAPVCEGGSS